MTDARPWLGPLSTLQADNSGPAVIDRNGTVTGRALLRKAASAADLLSDLEPRAGVPIPALLSTNADTLAMLIGGAAANRPLAPLGARLTAVELSDVVRRTQSQVVLAEPQFADTAHQIGAATGVRVEVLSALPESQTGLSHSSGPVAFFLHTSGTTGTPKRIPFTEEVLAARTRVLSKLIALGPGDRYASGSPVHHIGGLGHLLVALSVGAAVLPTITFSLDWWLGLGALGATHCLLVPAMIETLLAGGYLGAVPLKTLIYGAAPIDPATLDRVLQVLPDVELVNLFGQTEGSPITALTPQDHRSAAAGAEHLLTSVGRAVPGLRLKIHQPDAEGVGEVVAAAAHLSVQTADGWLHTGDLGALDDNGYLYLHGRRHDMVIRGGENVYPAEVERVLCSHPMVAAAGVVGVADQRLGETLAAFVVPRDPTAPPSNEELRVFARAKLAGFKVPAYWQEVQHLPFNSTGKLARRTLRRWHEQGRT